MDVDAESCGTGGPYDKSALLLVATSADPSEICAAEWTAREAVLRRAPLFVTVTHAGSAAERRHTFEAVLATVLDGSLDGAVFGMPPIQIEQVCLLSSRFALTVLSAPTACSGPTVAEVLGPVAVVPHAPPTAGPVVLAAAPWTAERAFEIAFEEARAHAVPLHAIRVWRDDAIDLGRPLPGPIAAFDARARQLDRELTLSLAAWSAAYPTVEVTHTVVEDRTVDQLLSVTTTAQLLVVGRSARGPRLVERVGSPLWPLICAARCPVLVVPT